jgi:hypothetical protein
MVSYRQSRKGKMSDTYPIVLPDSDALEYVTEDVACVYEDVDENLAIIRNMRTRKIVGFRLSNWSRLSTHG